jgi:hypothetical protein
MEWLIRPIEPFQRRLWHIRPIRRGGVLCFEAARYHGASVTLADGTVVRPGDPVGELHFDNRVARRIAAAGWQMVGLRTARADLAALARWSAAQPSAARPVAYHAETVLASLTRRVGFEVRPTPPDRMHRLRAWYLRGLLERWSPEGPARLGRGHGRLRLAHVWLSEAALQRRYGGPTDG